MSEAPSIPYLACPYMPAQSKAAACLDTLLPCSRIAYLLGFMLIQHLVVLLIWPAMCLCAWTSWARLRKERKGKKRHSFSAMALGGEGPNPEEGGETGGGEDSLGIIALTLLVELYTCFRGTCSWLCIYVSNAYSADCSAMQWILILLMMHPNDAWS